MTTCMDFLPSERVRVFISSAQNNENGVEWGEVRRRIKDALKSCVYLNPFIIEDEGAVDSSTQFFQREVERADIIVLLVKGEVRNGTSSEYSLATKLKKPLLAYFIDDDTPSLDVIKLKNKIQTTDQCTYRKFKDFKDIEFLIRDDIIKSVVRAFQDKASIDGNQNDSDTTEIYIEDIQFPSNVPTKTEIEKFKSCYNYLFDLLGLSFFKRVCEDSEHHVLGCALMTWLSNGSWAVDDNDLISFIDDNSKIYRDEDLLKLRWDAIRFYFSGDLKKSLKAEDEALAYARKSNESDWVINNILIDCRNIEIAISKIDRSYPVTGVYQESLSTQKNTVYLPVLDRFQNKIFEYIEKDEFRENTSSLNKHLHGTNLYKAICELSNYLFSAAIFGSVTHLLVTRRIFAYVLNHYSKLYNEPALSFLTLTQYMLYGDSNDFNLYITSTWDFQYSFLTTRADELWQKTDCVPISNRAKMKRTVLSSLGLYLSDTFFSEAENYLLSQSCDITWIDSEDYFDAISANLSRLNPDSVLQAIIPIIAERRFHLGNRISRIILNIDLSKANDRNLQALADALEMQMTYIIENNGDPQMIFPLIERSKTIFGKLETLEGNGLTGIQQVIYKINQGHDDWYQVMKTEIDSARFQFENNSKKGVLNVYDSNPYFIISYIIRQERISPEIYDLVIKEFIPLTIDVLNSEAALSTKDSCLACMCDVLGFCNSQNIQIPALVRETLSAVNIDIGTDMPSSSSKKAVEIRIITAQLLAGIVNEKELFRLCIEFEQLSTSERIVVVDCLEKYIFYMTKNKKNIDALVVSIILQCLSANHYHIRCISVRCLAYLTDSDYGDIAVSELTKAVFDPSAHVRHVLLNNCKKDLVSKELSISILSLLSDDANFEIRVNAKELLSKKGFKK